MADAFLLGWIGQCPVEEPYVLIGQIGSLYYFFYFLVLTPAIGLFEQKAILNR